MAMPLSMQSPKNPNAPYAKLEVLLKIVNDAAQAAIAEYEKLGDAPSPLATDPHPQDLQQVPNLALIKATRLLEGACDQLCATLSPPAHTLHQRAQVYYWSAFKVSQEAGIASLLEGRPEGVSAEELSAKTGIEKDNLTRILRMLTTRSLYTEPSPGVFAHSRLSANLLTQFYLSDTADLNLRYNSIPAMNLYAYLTHPERGSTKTYKDSAWCQHNNETSWFTYMYQDNGRRESFGRSMVGFGVSMALFASIFHFPWKDIKTVGDLGSGIGGMGSKLVENYSHLDVVLHDLPSVMNDARTHWQKSAPELVESGRLKFSDYNFFDGPPTPGLDVYIYRNVLLDWPDDACVTILQNCRKAMAPHSRVLIQDFIPHNPDSSKNSVQETAPEPMLHNFGNGSIVKYNVDLVMMTLFNSRLRTLTEFEILGEKAGLKLVDWYDFGDNGVMVFAAV